MGSGNGLGTEAFFGYAIRNGFSSWLNTHKLFARYVFPISRESSSLHVDLQAGRWFSTIGPTATFGLAATLGCGREGRMTRNAQLRWHI
jgi:hypothetical protein